MKRFKQIGLIIHLDRDNQHAIEYAQKVAKKNHASLFILIANRDGLTSSAQDKIDETLQRVIELPFERHFLVGQPVVEITHFAIKQHLDLLILEPDTQSSLKRFFFGSIALSLLRKAPCPVWLAKGNEKQAYSKILVCIDPDENDIEKQALNDKLVQIGTSFAQRESAECHLVCTWYLEGEHSLNSPFIQIPIEEIEDLKNTRKMDTARTFEAVQKRNQPHLNNCQTHLLYGEPAEVIADFVTDNNINLTVMGTVARTGIQGFVIGNTSESILNQIECSIMAVKPDGFKSPIS